MDELAKKRRKYFSFKPTPDKVSSECTDYLHHLTDYGSMSEWVSAACEFKFNYEMNRKWFFIRLIEMHFEEIKHLLRKIGSLKKKYLH